jgi:hypothetical protein
LINGIVHRRDQVFDIAPVKRSYERLSQRGHDLSAQSAGSVAIKVRWAEGRGERAADIAAEFVQQKVDVIVSRGKLRPLSSGSRPSSCKSVRHSGWAKR